jgi:predicted dehydrogenase
MWRLTQRRKPGTSWEEWLYDPARVGSPAMDLHIHDLDVARRLFGEPASYASRGTSYGDRMDHLFAQYTFPDGGIVHIESGWDFPLNYPFEMGYRCLFEGGCVDFRSSEPGVFVRRPDGSEERAEPPKPQIPDRDTSGNIASILGYYSEIKYFVDRLEAGRPIEEGNAADSLISLRLLLDVVSAAG